jgi:excisionase family DNA binding protein
MPSKAANAAFLTTEEVLSCLKLNPRTIYRLIKTGELPAIRIGRQWRFRRADLDEWIDRQRSHHDHGKSASDPGGDRHADGSRR